MANGTIKRGYDSIYYGSRDMRGAGVAISASEISFNVPVFSPDGTSPQITISGFGVTGIDFSGMTCTVDSDRTSGSAVCFAFHKTNGFTAGRAYNCLVNVTLSP